MKKSVISLMRAVALAYLPVMLILPAIMEDPASTIKLPYILIFLILLLYTIPFFAVYLEICNLTAFFLEGKEISRFRRILKIVGAVLAVGTLVSVIFINKAPAVCFTLVGALAIVMLTEAVVSIKSGDGGAVFKDKRTWILALAVTVLVSGIFLAVARVEDSKNKPDPEAQTACIRNY